MRPTRGERIILSRCRRLLARHGDANTGNCSPDSAEAVILAYFFFSLSYLGDKLILSGPPKPNAYTFYVAAISIFVVVFIPFIHFGFPDNKIIFWIIAEAAGLYLGIIRHVLCYGKL